MEGVDYVVPLQKQTNSNQPSRVIKIDVDGIEHLIIEGFGKVLNSVNRDIFSELNEELNQ